MTPDEYFQAFVIGNYEDFAEQPDCVRRGFNAAIAASHMADHYFKYFRKNDPTRISRFQNLSGYLEYVSEQTSGCFKDIRSIANAYKHLYTWKEICISSAGAIEVVQIKNKDFSDITQTYLETEDKYSVVFTRRTGEQFELLPVLGKVIDFWYKEIASSNGIVTIVPPPIKE